MTAPSPQARDGVLLNGRTVAPDGSWRPGRARGVADRNGVISLTLEPSSAALLTVEALPPRHRRRAKH
jgi:hypothetical protein